jgi:transposase
MRITRVGFDIAKQVLQVHGVDEHGVAKVRKTLTRGKVLEFFCTATPVPDRYGGMRRRTLLGS